MIRSYEYKVAMTSANFKTFIPSIIGVCIWIAYFYKSERVKETFDLYEAEEIEILQEETS
jgi:hypothetical protein